MAFGDQFLVCLAYFQLFRGSYDWLQKRDLTDGYRQIPSCGFCEIPRDLASDSFCHCEKQRDGD
jgi:hypothetical protein